MKRNRACSLIFATATLMAGCATSGSNARPQNIAALEQRVAAQPGNKDAATVLGVAYYNARRFADAQRTLGTVVSSGATNGAAYLYLGLADEELKDWQGARTAYEKYVAAGKTDAVKEQIRARLALVAREQLKAEARAVLAREQQISDEPPTPRTVAVMPFKLVGTSQDLEPLQTALSDMIITDLSVTPAITSIERVKVNAMIDEILLAQSGLADPEAGTRVGHLLKAENVVQGVLAQASEKELRMDATVLNTARRATAGSFGQSRQVDAIFDLEKAIVFNILNAVGVTLTAAETEKINENRTGNLRAFLAYGQGLDQLDKGNFQEASQYFRQASVLDPNFQPVRTHEVEVRQLQQAEQVTTTEIATQAAPEIGEPKAAPVEQPSNPLSSDIAANLNPSPADNLPAGTQTTQPPTTGNATNTAQNQSGNVNTSQGQTSSPTSATKATIIITIKKPGA